MAVYASPLARMTEGDTVSVNENAVLGRVGAAGSAVDEVDRHRWRVAGSGQGQSGGLDNGHVIVAELHPASLTASSQPAGLSARAFVPPARSLGWSNADAFCR